MLFWNCNKSILRWKNDTITRVSRSWKMGGWIVKFSCVFLLHLGAYLAYVLAGVLRRNRTARKIGDRGCNSTCVWRTENPGRQAREDEMRLCSSNSAAGKKANPSFLHLWFCSGPRWIGWCPANWGGQSLYWVGRFKYQSHLETPSQTRPEITFSLGTARPIKVTEVTVTICLCFCWAGQSL